jgi:two-component system chemotaxis response regulator CheB
MTATNSTPTASVSGVRAVVVDDSQFMRTVISDLLEEAGVDVVAAVSDGRAGVEAVEEHRPDVVTMDLKMPGMNGIEAVEAIMSSCPTPILVLSAHAADGAELTFEAMDQGAVDFFEKPSGEVSVGLKQQQDVLVSKIESVAAADVSAVESATTAPDAGTAARTRQEYLEKPTLVVGSSTGGPTVVEELLSALPVEADFRVLVVQHMPDGFTSRFAERLDEASDYSIREATDGARIGGGEGLVARGGEHMRVAGYGGGRLRVTLTEAEPVNNVRPAVDVTLQTAADTVDGPLTAAILTGMGTDGAEGSRRVSAAGGSVIAQNEETSAVFGMPQRAIEAGAVDDVRPRSELADGVLETIAIDQQ